MPSAQSDRHETVAEQLRALVALAERATPGEFTLKYGVNIMAGDGYSATSLESNLITEDRNAANAALLVAAVNFIRAHGPALLAAAEASINPQEIDSRLIGAEGVERDATRWRWFIREAVNVDEDLNLAIFLSDKETADHLIDAALNGGQDDNA